MPSVLFFAVIAFLFVTVLLFSRRIIPSPESGNAASLQALLNARSGAWKGVHLLQAWQSAAGVRVDTVTPVHAGDSAAVSRAFAQDKATLSPGAGVRAFELYDSDAFGMCSLAVDVRGHFLEVYSVGVCRDALVRMHVLLGSRPFDIYTDTLIYTETPGDPVGTGSMNGYLRHIEPRMHDSSAASGTRFAIDARRKAFFLDACRKQLQAAADTLAIQDLLPRTVKTTAQFYAMPDMINAALHIESSLGSIRADRSRSIVVGDELIISGDAHIEDVSFVCRGKIFISDDVRLHNVSLYTRSHIFLSGESVFSGDAIAEDEIEIYEGARVTQASTLLFIGPTHTRDRAQQRDTSQTGDSLQSEIDYGIQIRDEAQVDAVVVDAAARGKGIHTEPHTTISGILFSLGPVRHEGTLHGIIRAGRLTGAQVRGGSDTRNHLDGRVTSPDNAGAYELPYFIGTMHIIEWREGDAIEAG